MSPSRCLTILALSFPLLLGSSGCASEDVEESGAGVSDLSASASGSFQPLETLQKAFAALEAQRSLPAIAEFYEGPNGGKDGTRISACWANPAGSKLTDLQKSFYCSLPLEIRLCTSPAILRAKRDESLSEDAAIARQHEAFLRCQAQTNTQFRGLFVWTKEINDAFLTVFLKQRSGLTADEEATVVSQHKPDLRGKLFVVLLTRTVLGLRREADALGLDFLQMVKGAQLEEDQATDV